MWWIALALALAGTPDVDTMVGVGVLWASGEGTDVGVRPGVHALLRGRAVAKLGVGRVGGELDERSTQVLASRKSILLGVGGDSLSLLSGVGVVERGLFGPNARWDVHVPLELVVDVYAPVHLQARGRSWLTLAANPAFEGRHFGGEAALSAGLPGSDGFGPRMELGWREEFGHHVFLLVLGAGS